MTIRRVSTGEIRWKAVLVRRCKVTWYRLTVVRKDVTQVLGEKSPLESFSMAWTHDLVSISTHVRFSD